jgi:hypothetical protein
MREEKERKRTHCMELWPLRRTSSHLTLYSTCAEEQHDLLKTSNRGGSYGFRKMEKVSTRHPKSSSFKSVSTTQDDRPRHKQLTRRRFSLLAATE